jgi:hypothetical protein
MRAHWDPRDLGTIAARSLDFTPAQADLIRTTLQLRMRASELAHAAARQR